MSSIKRKTTKKKKNYASRSIKPFPISYSDSDGDETEYSSDNLSNRLLNELRYKFDLVEVKLDKISKKYSELKIRTRSLEDENKVLNTKLESMTNMLNEHDQAIKYIPGGNLYKDAEQNFYSKSETNDAI